MSPPPSFCDTEHLVTAAKCCWRLGVRVGSPSSITDRRAVPMPESCNGGRPKVFTGWTHLIPEHRSDTLRTITRPHMWTSATRSTRCLRNVGIREGGRTFSKKKAVTQSDFCLRSGTTKGSQDGGGRAQASPQQQQQVSGPKFNSGGNCGSSRAGTLSMNSEGRLGL